MGDGNPCARQVSKTAKKKLSRASFPGNLCRLMQQVNVGVIGAGTVGGGVFQAIQRNAALMASRLGVRLRIAKIAVRDLGKQRRVAIPAQLLTQRWESIVQDPAIDVVVELIGGTSVARSPAGRDLAWRTPSASPI